MRRDGLCRTYSSCVESISPSRSRTAREADLFGTSGNAWHQWNKHGRCTGLEAEAFYALSRSAFAQVNRPPVLRQIGTALRLPAEVVEDAFLEVNPQLAPDQITITCKSGRIQEARICLTKNLKPRDCGPDVRRDCTMNDALMAPVR